MPADVPNKEPEIPSATPEPAEGASTATVESAIETTREERGRLLDEEQKVNALMQLDPLDQKRATDMDERPIY